MSDYVPPPPPPAPHPAPAPLRAPMSGEAITAFVLSLVLGLVALFSGYWLVALVPIALGIHMLMRGKGGRLRGQGFAITAIVLGVLGALMGYGAVVTYNTLYEEIGEGALSALADEEGRTADGEGDIFTEWWLREDAAASGVAQMLRQRHASVVERFGAFTGKVEAGSTFGPLPLWSSPDVRAADEIAGPLGADSAPPTALMRALWVRAHYERGVLDVALVTTERPEEFEDVATGLERMAAGGKARILRDIRFYAPR